MLAGLMLVLPYPFLDFTLSPSLIDFYDIVILLLTAMGLERLDALQRGSYGGIGHHGFYVVIVVIAIEMVLNIPSVVMQGDWGERYLPSLFPLFLLIDSAKSYGLALYGIAILRARVLPRWFGVVLIFYAFYVLGSWLLIFGDIPLHVHILLRSTIFSEPFMMGLMLVALGSGLWVRRSAPTN